jgi:hypothetical protein
VAAAVVVVVVVGGVGGFLTVTGMAGNSWTAPSGKGLDLKSKIISKL